MTPKTASLLIPLLLLGAAPPALAQMSSNPPAIVPLKQSFDVPEADEQTTLIVDAAQAFLETLDADTRDSVVFQLDDDAQRSNWSNLPEGTVDRKGLTRGDMTEAQLEALDALLGAVLSEDGVRNIQYQLAAEDSLGGRRFSSDYYYVSFLGEPSVDAPWMMQFGGHHLALNVTVFGPDLTFSPMLTGGQPLNITWNGAQVYITERETQAAQTLLDSLSPDQKAQAVRSSRIASLLLGPGTFGTTVAPEGLKGEQMTDTQKALLVDLISARLGFINPDDFDAAMEVIRADLDETWFGWWGPEGTLGAAYFRVTGPRIVMEYAPQRLGGDYTDHAHSMYRDPANDYGTLWIELK